MSGVLVHWFSYSGRWCTLALLVYNLHRIKPCTLVLPSVHCFSKSKCKLYTAPPPNVNILGTLYTSSPQCILVLGTLYASSPQCTLVLRTLYTSSPQCILVLGTLYTIPPNVHCTLVPLMYTGFRYIVH